MTAVILNLYDVTNTPSENANYAITKLNDLTRGVFGVFHGGIEVYGVEWSFGFCEQGTGVYACHPKKNPMYNFREAITLGETNLTARELKRKIHRLQDEWQGAEYDLLAKNCCHFCEVLAAELAVQAPPVWINRAAYHADAAYTFTVSALQQVRVVSSATYDMFRYCLYGAADADMDAANQKSFTDIDAANQKNTMDAQ